MPAMLFHRLLLSYLLLLGVDVHGLGDVRLRDVLNARRANAKVTDESSLGADVPEFVGDVQTRYVNQQLNHYDASDTRSFAQRFFYSDRYARAREENRNTYAFLCVGGEGPALDESVLVDSVHCTGDMLELAHILFEDGHKVHLYALEHRYYGESYPVFREGGCSKNRTTSPVTNQHLVYLSSTQALADLAHFVNSRSLDGGTNIKWVTFGGSYPGMMAAWARSKYPHLIHAAVSSSAPVQAVLDFSAYNNHVSKVLASANVGGSSECLAVFQAAHGEVTRMVHDATQHAGLADMFGLCNATSLLEDRNKELFLGDGLVDLHTQGNNPSCDRDLCNIGKICRTLLNDAKSFKPVTALANLAQRQRDRGACINIDWTGTLDYISDPVRGVEGGLRSWLWQTCTEFGFYQTCNMHSTCPYGRGFHRVDQDLEMCRVAFDKSGVQVATAVRSSMEAYGGWKMEASRILSVNGDIDPWSELAIHDVSNPQLPTYQVPGASHHFWTHKVLDSDGLEIQKAREFIYDTVTAWLETGSPNEPTTVN
jgi:hypothetical protein